MIDRTQQLQSTEVVPSPQTRSGLLKREMPGLDILRGVAVLAVLLDHGLAWDIPPCQEYSSGVVLLEKLFREGWLGVNLFFVLSGFLITGILIDTKQREHYWRDFYTRRVLRIMPLYLTTVGLLSLLPQFHWKYLGLTLVFLANWAAMLPNLGATYAPLWSLAVEEQFYLFWPFLLRRISTQRAMIAASTLIVICPVLRSLAVHRATWLGDTYTTTWLIGDNLAWGALLAAFLRTQFATLKRVRIATGSLLTGAVISLGITTKFHLVSRTTGAGAAFGIIPFELAFAGLLLLALRFGDRPGIVFWSAPLRFLGYISYGLYLANLALFNYYDMFSTKWRGPISLLTAPTVLIRFGIILVLGSALCFLSRRYFEERFLRMKQKLAPLRASPA